MFVRDLALDRIVLKQLIVEVALAQRLSNCQSGYQPNAMAALGQKRSNQSLQVSTLAWLAPALSQE